MNNMVFGKPKEYAEKGVFKFEYTKPALDWFDIIEVEIKPDEYCYYRIERRFGPSWWLIGMNPVNEPEYHWKEKQIGSISEKDLARFIKWAETDIGSNIIEIKAISGSFNILKEIEKLLAEMK